MRPLLLLLAVNILGSQHVAADAAASQTSLQQQALQHWHQQLQTASEPIIEPPTAAARSSRIPPEQNLRFRRLAQNQPPAWKPSGDEKEKSKTAGHFSAGHAALVFLLCLIAFGVLGYSGYKSMQWYGRTRRPGYVELQSLDSAFHRPGAF